MMNAIRKDQIRIRIHNNPGATQTNPLHYQKEHLQKQSECGSSHCRRLGAFRILILQRNADQPVPRKRNTMLL